MKHFFGATPDGRLHWSFIMSGGYDGTSVDLDAADPQDPHAQHLLSVYNKNMSGSETLDCIVVFECPCPPGGDATCDCPGNKRMSAYCENGQLVDKPACQVLLDGTPIAGETLATRAPNTLFTVQVVGDPVDHPDGATVEVYSTSMLENNKVTLTFTGGQTNTATLRAPAQGAIAQFSVVGKLVCPTVMQIKGFLAIPS